MLDRIIRASLRHRWGVLVAAFVLLVAGGALTSQLPVDIFPDLTAPTVTVITEAKGLAPEELELLVTFPVESALNGASGVRRIRSVSGPGIAVVWVEFEWGEDVYLARQIVAERLQTVSLPTGVERPTLGPISSIMGEITFMALTSDRVSAMELRRLAETVVRRNLLAVPGISQVVPIGGDVREYLVQLDPAAVIQAEISVKEVVKALEEASAVPAAGFHVDGGQEYLVRGLGRARSTGDLAATVLRVRGGIPLRLGQIASIELAAEPARGTASYRGKPAVILSVQKQPGANTLALTQQIDRVLDDLQRTLPPGVVIEKENFRQADFIEVAIHNVSMALRDGGILVVIILFLFLGNVRTTFISALAIPLSLVAGVVVISLFGGTLNTMTLGGMEGRLLRPLGLAYLASLAGSLLVALTVTPVLCLMLLPHGTLLDSEEPWLLRLCKRAYDGTLAFCLDRRALVLGAAVGALVVAFAILPFLGQSFLPPFNEASLTLALVS